MSFYTQYVRPPVVVSPSGGVSMTEQQFKNDCDINNIIQRFQQGQMPCRVRSDGSYGDFSNLGDFATNLSMVEEAKSRFQALPSALRDRFGNSPQTFFNWVLDPSNKDECIRLGLRVPPSSDASALDVLKSIDKKLSPPSGAALSSGGAGSPVIT
ncbi:minor capsid protein [Capybara microvirus Cap1_SP_163]|nr:minor capsid protein [Capybara microvirus Cap1_SP_163]